jgi:rod shape determining protein RodA
VIILGKTSMGAQRWLDLYFFSFQPSEIVKISMIFSLAKYISTIGTEDQKRSKFLIIPIIIIAIPTLLVSLQPDLGTAMILIVVGLSLLFVSGVQLWKFGLGLCAFAVTCPVFWSFLHDYQKKRILIFLNPELDPSGAGYHIIQSKVALGSGAIFGKGLFHGTQCQLNFLPEKQTDFVFAALGEELGFVGTLTLLLLYTILIVCNLKAIFKIRNKFERLVIFGMNSVLFFYVLINVSMVCGLLPVVGVPLPFFSYGGSSMVMMMFCQGVIFSASRREKNYK